MEEYEASMIVKELLLTLKYIHSSGIIHRDLKAENILIVKDKMLDEIKRIKLIDFGFSTYIHNNELLHDVCGTPNYLAPEVYLGDYDLRSDIFSIGVLMYFMVRGTLPFHSHSVQGIINRTISGEYEIHEPFWANVSDECKDLLSKILKIDKDERITIDEALSHDWITVI